eukprot:TRINITY_DN25877_c0_g1_i1.p1 TRINITY_DN25877_c0_g1~~TRINITY_DN25877_c0_g1_i1.p1  ORF type:complete len:515 (+),score=115.86 TRINITY_DN25877_c0_g1_i1:116-1660(+)
MSDSSEEEEEEKTGGDEDDSEKVKVDDGDGRPVGKPKQYAIFHSDEVFYEDKGRVIEQENFGFYGVGPNSQVGVLFVGDLYGYAEGRVREIADYIAETLKARVVVPRLLDEPSMDNGIEGDGMPEGFDQTTDPQKFKSWIMKYTWESFRPKVQMAVTHLRLSGAVRIAGVGFGFGAWIVSHSSTTTGEFVASVQVHPELVQFEEMNAREPEVLAKKIRGAVLWLGAGKYPPKTYLPKGEIFELVAKNNKGCEAMNFPGMKAGWAIRGDVAKLGVRPSTVSAVMLMLRHLRKFLWPPPPGLNAASLRLASKNGDAELIEEIVAGGVDVTGKDAVDAIGLAPAHYAAREGQSNAIKLLFAADADPNEAGGIGSESPLHIAALHGKAKCCQTLIELKANVQPINKAGQTPLHLAAREGMLGVVKTLLNGNASIAPTDTGGQTPLHLAAFRGKGVIVAYLLEMKMDVEPEDIRVRTPYHRALENGFQVVADALKTVKEQREAESFFAKGKQSKEAEST